MSRQTFEASSWLQTAPSHGLHETHKRTQVLAKSYRDEYLERDFDPTSHLLPGWKGGSLLSKPAILLNNLIPLLSDDACEQLKSIQGGKSHLLNLYNEFIDWAQSKDLHINLDNVSVFVQHFKDESSPYKKELEEFQKHYSFRAVVKYLLKIKFLTALSESLEIHFTKENLMNPTSFLVRIFQGGGSTELRCESLQSSPYSWYRPSKEFCEKLMELGDSFGEIKITELMKVFTYQEDCKSKNLLNLEDKEYSHSLSHLSFGLFMNSLLVYLPEWIENHSDDKWSGFKFKKKSGSLEVLNTKFTGQKLASLSLGHRLAQENNLNAEWSKIICPDFIGSEFQTGQFAKICQELLFLSFLIDVAKTRKENPIQLICKTFNDKNSRQCHEDDGQGSFLGSLEGQSDIAYERIVLNIPDLPKRNPHFALVNQVTTQLEEVEPGGMLFVMTNQNLFVPSQSERIKQLLKLAKLEVSFNLSNLKWKGKIPGHLYVFTKRGNSLPSHPFLSSEDMAIHEAKENSFSFSWSGELKHFKLFDGLASEFSTFLKEKTPTTTPLFLKELDEGLVFEFHQDAIMDGKLMSSISKDKEKITHPHFFKCLTNSSLPFDHFFHIQGINPNDALKTNDWNSVSESLLGLQYQPEAKYRYILVANFSNPTDIQVEIIDSKSYRATLENYGTAFFHYFGLVPKTAPLNINLFREYFNHPMGHQVIQLSLSGGTTKLKPKLRALLIPSFFKENVEPPEHLENCLAPLKLTKEKILSMHPKEFAQITHNMDSWLLPLGEKYPWFITGLLSHFKFSVAEVLNTIKGQKYSGEQVDFQNPVIIEKLIQLKSHSLFPKNEDAFLDFNISSNQDIHLPLSEVKLGKDNNNHYLALLSEEDIIVKIYSDEDLLKFAKFILKSANGRPISQLITQLKIPRIQEFKEVIQEYKDLSSEIEAVRTKAQLLLTDIIKKQILQQR